jgi:hypothetical protein
MLVCAIVSARVRNGATLPSHRPNTSDPLPTSESFYRPAIKAFPSSLSDATDFNYLRAKSLMAILCAQYGDVRGLHTHLGDYGTLSMNEGFYDEQGWPVDLTEVDKQERRRLVSS